METAEAPETAFGDLAAITVLSTVLLLLALLVLFLVLRWKKKQRIEDARVEDENPVYGMYYFADGRRIDQGRSEVSDDNGYYGS